MGWAQIGILLAGLGSVAGLLGTLFTRRKIVSEANLTSVAAAEKVNQMLYKQLEQMNLRYQECLTECTKLRNELRSKEAECDRRLGAQDDKIRRLERKLNERT